MDYIILLILALLSGATYYNYDKRKEAETDALLGDTLGRDKELQKQQHTLREATAEIDERIKTLKEQRQEEDTSSGDLKDRQNESRKIFDK